MNAAQWIALALGAVVVLAAADAAAGYRDLARDWESYQPGAYYRSQLVPVDVPAAPEPEGADDFARQVRELEQVKARWQADVAEAVAEDAFHVPDAARIQALAGAATDPEPAAAALAGPFPLATLEILVWLRNPAIRAAERALRASLERYDQAWNLDEILRQYSAFTEALMPGVGPMKGSEPVRMGFPFPGVLALKGQIVSREVEAQRESAELARRTALTMARTAYWNLGFVGRARAITAETVGLLEHLEAVATTRYEAGKTSFQDVIKVRIERETLQEELQTLVEKQATLETKIRELADLPAAAAFGHPAPGAPERAVPDLAALTAQALERRQELRQLKARIGKMERMIELAETRIYPDFTLGLAYYEDRAVTQVGTARMQEPFATTTPAAMGAGLPKMPWYATGNAFVRETRQQLAAARETLRATENRTRSEVRERWFILDEAARQERLFAERIVDLSQAALEVSTRGYETGTVMFADVIASYTTWLKANLALARKRADLGVARAELQQAVGASALVAGTGP